MISQEKNYHLSDFMPGKVGSFQTALKELAMPETVEQINVSIEALSEKSKS